MRLKSFKGENIRGYLNFDITFRDKMTFLIGVNGSGKTTVLNLIHGLLNASLQTLESIDYSLIEVRLVKRSIEGEIVVSSRKDKEKITIKIERLDGQKTSVFRRAERSDAMIIRDGYVMEDANFEALSAQFMEQPACVEILKLKAPMFIGLERLPKSNDIVMPERIGIGMRSRRKYATSVDECLVYVQNAINDMVRRNGSRQNVYAMNFRNKILQSSLRFSTDQLPAVNAINIAGEIQKLDEKKQEFLDAVRDLEIKDIEDVMQEFFMKLKSSLQIMTSGQDHRYTDSQRTEATLAWFINSTQLKKVDEMIAAGHDYQKNMDRINEPLRRFENSVNLFFNESGKQLFVAQNGQVKVKMIDREGSTPSVVNNINELSSGEKQIVAMFGSLVFLNNSQHNCAYFVDEPELSLHIAWQDIYVDALLTACPDYQFVLATHSPNIVSKSERREWCEDLSPKRLS